MNEWHTLDPKTERPQRMNDPFDYAPHPACRAAAREVVAHIAELTAWKDEVAAGKMFGVLVCEDAAGRLGFLAAYSGQIGGRSDWPWFVPAVFDYLQPDGYFKQEEARITALNHRVARLESTEELAAARARVQHAREQADSAIADYRRQMSQAKARRDALRSAATTLPHAEAAALERESQHQKAELRRLKQRWRTVVDEAEAQLAPQQQAIDALRRERSQRSDALQRWLFDQFRMLNARGESITLTEIFRQTPQRVPPAGAGECCAPRLLQYAYSHGLRPLQIAEFWQGRSPRMEIRHHGQYYGACRGKCKPILEWMLGTAATPTDVPTEGTTGDLQVVYEDADVLVVEKPSGLLSVPGLTGAPSVEQLLGARYGRVYMVHRLDMDTSGLMVVARTPEAHHALQRQFLARTIYKRYEALLDGHVEGRGTISLPLRPDPTDRPRQLVDTDGGKAALTDYEVTAHEGRLTRVALTPHTGRTHQLRVHCAHADGLATPIVGDALYGRRQASGRLCLHAACLRFVHPTTGQTMTFASAPDF